MIKSINKNKKVILRKIKIKTNHLKNKVKLILMIKAKIYLQLVRLYL
jgi:hypothetical protein